ncbi:DUF4397 domain-containing protein [Hymenobacter arizonensis]|uniref:DUF4397 domain-containing protein n=1 Tax=Hymenobacter arizonensis TaxID=1227077 RepID=A0A1I5ZZC2_HYMAR|nr:DUF4397 domain-containing protein [Hymenobacter arizonensis]SFQ61831.1 protein of unknown function [Hymenobacter arizonensis]
MKFSFASLFTKLTLATSVAGALVGCDEPKYPEPTPIATPSTDQARYQVVNAAPGAGAAQLVSIDNVAPTTAFTFAALPYLSVVRVNIPAGQRLLIFSTAANNNREIATRLNFSTNSNTTIFLTDPTVRVASGTDLGGVRTVALVDNFTPVPATGRARIRFVNLAPTATGGNTSYGIFNVGNPALPTSLFSAVPFRAYRAINNVTNATPPVTTNFANFTEVAAGVYTLDVRSNATTILAGTTQAVTFESGKFYTVYTRGIAGNSATPLGISTVLHN